MYVNELNVIHQCINNTVHFNDTILTTVDVVLVVVDDVCVTDPDDDLIITTLLHFERQTSSNHCYLQLTWRFSIVLIHQSAKQKHDLTSVVSKGLVHYLLCVQL